MAENCFISAEEFANTALQCLEDQCYLATVGKTIEEKKRFKAEMIWSFGGMMGGFPPEKMPDNFVNGIPWDEAAIAARNVGRSA